MSRDHRKLKVFGVADERVVEVYRAARQVSVEERYGLQPKYAVRSCPFRRTSSRAARPRTTRDVHFLVVALGSASEVRYLLGLARRLEFRAASAATALESRYDGLVRSLESLIKSLDSRS